MSIYYTDGSGFNGEVSRYAVTNDTGHVVTTGIIPEERTSNEMEYEGVISALQIAKDGDTIYSDSQLVINQLTKKWKVKARNLISRYNYAKELYFNKNVKLLWIRRDKNLAGKIFE